MPRYAALDIGSNSVRMLAAEIGAQGEFQILGPATLSLSFSYSASFAPSVEPLARCWGRTSPECSSGACVWNSV